tara:strand:+ start:2822 stop:3568 length:747 start_codon:yes stop_codon:yes gene_type:complete
MHNRGVNPGELEMTARSALVTGSSSGIGKAICQKLLQAGFKVVGLARNHEKFNSDCSNYFPYSVDLSNSNETTKILKKILLQHPEINILVSNAGYGKFQSLENYSTKQIKEFIELNLIAHILVCQFLVKHLKKNAGGDIIIMGSEAAIFGRKKATLYSAAKFGLRGFSQALREEVSSSGLRVSIVNPGMVRTPFFDELEFGPGENKENAIEANDVAKIVTEILTMRRGTMVEEVNLSPTKKVIKFRPS